MHSLAPLRRLLHRARTLLSGRRARIVFTVASLLQLAFACLPSDAADGAPPRTSDGAATGAASQAAFVVRNVRVFDGLEVLPRADVLVRDGRIVAFGPQIATPAGTTVIDGAGRTLLPGLIDAHTHSYGNARRDAVRFGVTTELDMFGDWHQIAEAKRARESLAPTALADLWSAGTLATVPHGHGTEYGFPIPTLTRPDEAQAFVDARVAEGSDYVKIILEDGSAYGHTIPSLDAATAAALATAAHADGKLALAHVATEAEAREAIDGRVDGLAHVFFDRPASPDTIERARRAHTFVVATLSVVGSAAAAGNGAQLVADARLAPWLTAGQADALKSAFPGTWQNPAFLVTATDNVRRLHAAGVPILAGTDAGNPGTAHGASLHGELALLVAAGLSPTEALSAATALPAQHFGLADRGRIAVGERADLLLVDGDPTRDIEATRAIVAIWKNGVAIDRTLLADERATRATEAPTAALIADFEGGDMAVRFGQDWTVTTDALIGGKSTAVQAWIAGGADGSKGAMRVTGTVAPELPFAWSGTLFMPGAKPFDAVDFTHRKMLVFKVRSTTRRTLSAMLFSGAATRRQPSIVPVDVTDQWSTVRIPLARFEGGDLAQVRGLAFVAGVPAGAFDFEIDDVRIE